MRNYLSLFEFSDEKAIVTIFTLVLVIVFVVFLTIFLILDYKNAKIDEIRKKLYKNAQKFTKFEVTTIYSDKSKNFSGTEILPVPTKPATKEYSYEFAGWDKNYFNESGDVVVRAIFVKIDNNCVVNFFSDDKTTIFKTIEVAYGKGIDVSSFIPTKDETNEFSFEFIGWNKDVSAIYEDTNVYAIFKAFPKKYTYTFFDKDRKTIILQETGIYGTPIKMPQKPNNTDENLVFSHWDNYRFEMPLEKNETFVAVYKNKDGEFITDLQEDIDVQEQETGESNESNIEENLVNQETSTQDIQSFDEISENEDITNNFETEEIEENIDNNQVEELVENSQNVELNNVSEENNENTTVEENSFVSNKQDDIVIVKTVEVD